MTDRSGRRVPQGAGRIVVGLDGSPSSLAALAWAHRQAALTGCSLDLVGAWGFPVYLGPELWPIGVDLEAIVEMQLRTALEKVVPAGSEVTCRLVIRRCSPSQALLEVARGAELLVVGTRGRGEVAEMVLGSVSMFCVAHASCPVIVVPLPRDVTAEAS